MIKIGLKLWSTNIEVLPQVKDMYARAIFDYIELYFVPGISQNVVSLWKGSGVPVVIHAPHFSHGFNLADSKLAAYNLEVFKDVSRCADMLNASIIIVHGGNGGTKNEMMRQLQELKDPRILIENKPMMGLNGKECIGYTPEDIREIVDKCGLKGFVLDFNHAVCSARSLAKDPLEHIKGFAARRPKMFHFGDGDYFSLVDIHKHLGQGNMPLNEFIAFLPQDTQITIETPNNFLKGLEDFDDNRAYFYRLLKAAGKG